MPSPIYNSRIIQHLTPKPHLVATHALKEGVPAFGDALALLRVWAHQRGYGVGDRLCVRGFEGRGTWWAGLLECLVLGEEGAESGGVGGFSKKEKRRPLGKGLSSYQLFKAALDFLGTCSSCSNQISHKAHACSQRGTTSLRSACSSRLRTDIEYVHCTWVSGYR